MDEKEIELRNISYVDGRVEMRAEGEKRMIVGEAIVYERESDAIYGQFIEVIQRGALDDADMSRVVGRTNHDDQLLLGTSWANTLRLTDSPSALRYEIDVPDTTAGRDTEVLMERGDIAGSSFAFGNVEDIWTDRSADQMLPLRTITSIGTIYDVSPVTTPAYPDATSGLRSFEQWNEKRQKEAQELIDAEEQRKEKLKADSETLKSIHKHKTYRK